MRDRRRRLASRPAGGRRPRDGWCWTYDERRKSRQRVRLGRRRGGRRCCCRAGPCCATAIALRDRRRRWWSRCAAAPETLSSVTHRRPAAAGPRRLPPGQPARAAADRGRAGSRYQHDHVLDDMVARAWAWRSTRAWTPRSSRRRRLPAHGQREHDTHEHEHDHGRGQRATETTPACDASTLARDRLLRLLAAGQPGAADRRVRLFAGARAGGAGGLGARRGDAPAPGSRGLLGHSLVALEVPAAGAPARRLDAPATAPGRRAGTTSCTPPRGQRASCRRRTGGWARRWRACWSPWASRRRPAGPTTPGVTQATHVRAGLPRLDDPAAGRGGRLAVRLGGEPGRRRRAPGAAGPERRPAHPLGGRASEIPAVVDAGLAVSRRRASASGAPGAGHRAAPCTRRSTRGCSAHEHDCTKATAAGGGVAGPVGSGKTALMDALCKRLRDATTSPPSPTTSTPRRTRSS